MKHVTQTNPFNCGSACAAMLCQTSLKQIENDYRRPGKDYGDESLVRKACGINQMGLCLSEFTFLLFEYKVPFFMVAAEDNLDAEPKHPFNEPAVKQDLRNAQAMKSIEEWIEYADAFDMAILMGVKVNSAADHWVVYYNGLIHDPKLSEPLSGWDPATYTVNSELLIADLT